jgi:hypothetical protein
LAPIGRTPDESVARATAIMNTVGYDYFKTLGYTMLGGREFDPARGEDVRPQGPPSGKPINVVIDASLAEEIGFSPPESAVEQDIYFPSNAQRAFNSVAQPLHIIGVVGNKPLRFSGAGAKSNMFFMNPGLQNQLVQISASDVSGGAAIDALWKRLSPRPRQPQVHGPAGDENCNFARVRCRGARARGDRDLDPGALQHGRAGREPPAARDGRVSGRACAPDRRDAAVAVRAGARGERLRGCSPIWRRRST